MDFISLLRFFSTIFITNSHFGDLYPSGYASLATGGMIGNASFFFCSGYTLYISICKSPMGGGKWLIKRLLRIYPSVWLFRIVSYLFLGTSLHWINIIKPGFWFLDAIIIFYFIFYFLIKYCKQHIRWIIIVLIIPFFISFLIQQNRYPNFIIEETANLYCLHYFYLFAIMLFGAHIASGKKIIHPRINKKDYKYYIQLVIAIGLYYGYKGILIKYNLWFPQLLLPIFLILVIYFMYKVATILMNAELFQNSHIQSFVIFVSNLTLDIYIVQFTCIGFSKISPFPLGYVEAIGLIAVSAILLNFLSKKIIRFLNAKLKLNT